ncbi:MAG: response regulator [Anaerolineae bacterium]|nr:response regulator [Anaerolineae bacterium]MBN8619465.1 response regulator [Anaerolineae bacterium]
MNGAPLALVVDDVAANREFAERLLGGARFKVTAVGTGKAALQVCAGLSELTLALIDMKLPDMTGLELVAHLRERYTGSCLVVASMYDERSMIEKAFAAGCNIYLVKPHGFMELFQRLLKDGVNVLRNGPLLVIDQYGPRQFKPIEKPPAV